MLCRPVTKNVFLTVLAYLPTYVSQISIFEPWPGTARIEGLRHKILIKALSTQPSAHLRITFQRKVRDHREKEMLWHT